MQRDLVVAVAAERRILGHQFGQNGLQVALNVRIGVHLDRQRGRGVGQEQGEEPVATRLPAAPGGDLAGDLANPWRGARNDSRSRI